MGITFISYLTSLRMDHAAWLLTHTSQTVFTIAAQVGYSDYFYFAKVFKKAMGCTPTAFRKSTPRAEVEASQGGSPPGDG